MELTETLAELESMKVMQESEAVDQAEPVVLPQVQLITRLEIMQDLAA
jgi:hypothetical protein